MPVSPVNVASLVGSLLGTKGLARYNASQVGRATPAPNGMSAGEAISALGDAFQQRTADISGVTNPKVNLEQYPGPGTDQYLIEKKAGKAGKYAEMARGKEKGTGETAYVVRINPNADRAYLAHELGHVASDHTKIGNLVGSLRDNPKLTNALAAAVVGVPAVTSALEAGDDDLDSSLAIAALASSPKLIDEALANKNALAMLKGANMPATLGQKGRLAGSYLSYVAPAIIGGLGGNLLGNLVDDYVAVY